ncbi:MAG: hypothetical protein ACJ0RQ_07735 [Candidatus Azotimanducaceae bacterium]
MFGITSEPQSLASEAESAWDLSFPIVGDPHHEIREALSRRGWLDVFFNEDFGHLRNRSWASHPKGYYQPAVIAVDRSQRVLYRWRCVPRYSNMSGAGARPEARYTLDQIVEAQGQEGDATLDREPLMGANELSWLKFLVLLTAHGWFLRPKVFPLLRDGTKDSVTPGAAMRRAYIFAGLWLLALVMLPLAWVAGAFVTWLIALTPGLLEIHRQFQNEKDVE